MPPEAASDTGIDVDAAVGQIGSNLFGAEPPEPDPAPEPAAIAPDPDPEPSPDPAPPAEPAPVEGAPAPVPATVKAPNSWDKFNAEHFHKIHPAQQSYIHKREQQMLEGIEQYKDTASFGSQMKTVFDANRDQLNALGVTEAQALTTLMEANRVLTTGSLENRVAAFQDLGRRLGLPAAAPNAPPAGATEQADPHIQQMQSQIQGLTQSIQQEHEVRFNEAKQQAVTEVDTFANDPTHPYFDELSDDIAKFISVGYSLTDAYDRSVWANPVTREKEILRVQTEHEEKIKVTQRESVATARKANAANVQSRETSQVPTEQEDSMEQTLKATMKAIKERA